jgi:CHAD domain-containing protein
MQQKDMADVINDHFDTINKLTRKVTDHFHNEVIHDLRIEIKKLRAFLSLVKTEPGDTDELKLKRRLKSFNGYIGILRNIHLQEHILQELLPKSALPTIEEYMAQLRSDAEEWKKEAAKLTRGHQDFDEERDVILNALPNKLSKISVRKFLRHKAEEIEGLLILRQATDNNLHALRTVLKTILYTWPFVKNEAELLPLEMNCQQHLQTLADVLGQYGDQCTALDFLQPSYLKRMTDEKGKEWLRLAQGQLEKRRDLYRRDFFTNLLNIRDKFPGYLTTGR